jgi:hypothetical protein
MSHRLVQLLCGSALGFFTTLPLAARAETAQTSPTPGTVSPGSTLPDMDVTPPDASDAERAPGTVGPVDPDTRARGPRSTPPGNPQGRRFKECTGPIPDCAAPPPGCNYINGGCVNGQWTCGTLSCDGSEALGR